MYDTFIQFKEAYALCGKLRYPTASWAKRLGHDWRKVIYWLAAAALTSVVTF